jgi:hypothetical protein
LIIDWVDGDLIPPELLDSLQQHDSGLQPDDAEDVVEETVEEDDVFENIVDVIFEELSETE